VVRGPGERDAIPHPERVGLLRATLDHHERKIATGESLPLLWHWLYFPPQIRQSALGDDGHTRDSSLLPDVPFLPRRMWAGSRLRSEAPLRIGDRITRRSEVMSLTPNLATTARLPFIPIPHPLQRP